MAVSILELFSVQVCPAVGNLLGLSHQELQIAAVEGLAEIIWSKLHDWRQLSRASLQLWVPMGNHLLVRLHRHLKRRIKALL